MKHIKDFTLNEGESPKITAGDISFSNGTSKSGERGAGAATPKVTAVIKGLTNGKAFMRGDWSGAEGDIQNEIFGLVVEFLNNKKTKAKIADIINQRKK